MVIEELKIILNHHGFKVEVENDVEIFIINGIKFNYSAHREALYVHLPNLINITTAEQIALEAVKFPELKLSLTSKNLVKRLHTSFELLKNYLKIYNNIRLARIESNLKLKSELQVFIDRGFEVYQYHYKFDIENMNLEDQYYEFTIESDKIKFRYHCGSESIYKLELSDILVSKIFEIQEILK